MATAIEPVPVGKFQNGSGSESGQVFLAVVYCAGGNYYTCIYLARRGVMEGLTHAPHCVCVWPC